MGVVLFTLGGTIAMAGSSDGVVARLGGADVIAGMTGLDDVDVRDLLAVPSSTLTFANILDVVDLASAAVADGATGIVLTQGTDTLEETAFLIDCVWQHKAPFVVTGAMRNPTMAGADGPANVLAAVQVARAPSARSLGALVVFNDEVHAARFVRKTHSTSTATFTSPGYGPLGHVVEGVPHVLMQPRRRTPVLDAARDAVAATRIAFYTTTLDDDGTSLGPAAACDGLVVAAFGVGHVPAALVPILGDLAARMPVVLASRTGSGFVLANTYGGPGSEIDLLRRGLIGGGNVHPYKAKILLRLLVASGADHDRIRASFRELGS